MSELFTIENFANLGVLLFLLAVLGFDNLLDIIQSGYQKKLRSERGVA